MVADKGKKSKVTEVDDSDQTDGDLILSVEKLQETQEELEKINEEACDKVLEVEQKYNEIRRPVYLKRNEIIKEIPDFWLTAFLSHPALCDLLTEEDQKIFKYLDSLDVEDFKDVKSGFCITFNFKENPHFEDTKLTKTFAFSDEGTNKITGTNIKWKEGMGTANGVNHEKKGNKRPLAQRSFFSWFDETEWNASEPQDDVADIIKEDLWPNPLKYFSNEADEEDSDQDEDEKENGAGDDEEEEDEDGNEEEN
ncbi:NAP1-related protein 2 isoform X2 [Jatropha curcas]|uniref:NAP1-related protein 2 isoform X2 n=1 Tax=Jatropha curcas TaxID=180498 RepID=UPI0005FB123C|nr:NAP1-related protein 2 isoform X2 [Jatropha curcas]